MRRRAAALCRLARRGRVSVRCVAGRLGMAPQTLSDWTRRVPGRPRGRPRRRVRRETRAGVVELLEQTRGRIGVPSLKRAFAEVPRRRLRRLVAAYRRRHRNHPAQLRWTRPGTVWAVDFTELATPIEGRFPHVLSVRDLASSRQVLAMPARTATADVTVQTLQALLAGHDAPLVLKSDNGSHFAAEAVRAALEPAAVTHLRSPPGTPRYNGSIEAGIGSLQIRLHQIASIHGRAAAPTCDDLEQARREANAEARPWGPAGPSPDQRWDQRTPITDEERRAFRAAVAATTVVERRRLEDHRRRDGTRTRTCTRTEHDRATVARRAIRRALVESGLLIISGSASNSSTHLSHALTEN